MKEVPSAQYGQMHITPILPPDITVLVSLFVLLVLALKVGTTTAQQKPA